MLVRVEATQTRITATAATQGEFEGIDPTPQAALATSADLAAKLPRSTASTLPVSRAESTS